MHEHSLMNGVLDKIRSVVEQDQLNRIISIQIRLGAMSNISAQHFREHFIHAVAGTPMANVKLTVVEGKDIFDEHAQEIRLESVELEE